jgi:hypothetical protein
MNRHTPSPTVIWPYRPRNTHVPTEPPVGPDRGEDGFDDSAARLAAPGRALQQTMDAMVRVAVAQDPTTH